MKKTAKQKIEEYLNEQNCWISGLTLEGQYTDWGHKASYISREARHLAEEGKIQRREDGKGYVWYSTLGIEKPKPREVKIITKEDGSRVAVYV